MPQRLRTSKAAIESPSSSSSDDEDGVGRLDAAVLKKLQQRRARIRGCDAASLLGSNIDTKVKAAEEGLSMGHFSSQTSDVTLNPLMAQYVPLSSPSEQHSCSNFLFVGTSTAGSKSVGSKPRLWLQR
jgi:hypothetical protein